MLVIMARFSRHPYAQLSMTAAWLESSKLHHELETKQMNTRRLSQDPSGPMFSAVTLYSDVQCFFYSSILMCDFSDIFSSFPPSVSLRFSK